MHVGFEIFGLLHVFERRVHVRAVLGERLNEFFRADERQPLELDQGELLAQQRRAGTHVHGVRLQKPAGKKKRVKTRTDQRRFATRERRDGS